MGAMQRNKGASGERELCRLLGDELGVELKRNVDQAREGGADCLQLPGFTVEIKRHEALNRDSWWEQAVRQAVRHGGEAIVFYRANRKPWRALIHGAGTYKDIGWADALDYCRDKLARLHGIYREAA